jgi:hypothetical protein
MMGQIRGKLRLVGARSEGMFNFGSQIRGFEASHGKIRGDIGLFGTRSERIYTS